jgi:hypothetical protein
MADWTDPPWAQLVAGKPWTDEKAAAAFENVLALAEGANGAPKVLGKALDIDIGNLSGTTAIVGLGDCAKLLLVAKAEATASSAAFVTATIGYQRTANGGSSWDAGGTIATSKILVSSDFDVTALASGAVIVDMVGYDGIRLTGSGGTYGPTLSGAAIWVEGV